jgi:type I restriction-modification system DNA methylase subunit
MANDPFVLRHLFEFLVPSQCRCGKDLDKKLVNKSVEEVKTAMGTWFGGFGQTTIRGGWVLETGKLTEETVEVIYSNATTECWHAHRQDFFDLAQEMADRLAQESVACRINQKLHLIDGRTECVHVTKPKPRPVPAPPPSPEAQRRARLNEMEGALRRLFKKEEGNDPILDLMVHTLNYPHASAPVPVGKWPGDLRALLLGKQSPHVIAETATGFKVILIGMENPKLLLMEQRQIIERMLQDNPSLRALFIVTNKEHAQWHFVNVREGISGKRLLLRRFRLLSAYQAIRTVVEQFLRLDLETIGTEASVDTIKAAHDHAFDVQSMTDAFFKKFAEVFTFTKERIAGIEDQEQGHLFTQQLFNRLLFLSFIDKKGWLRFEGPGSYFENLWDDYHKKSTAKNKGFYKERLEPLFFETLNQPKDEISNEDARRLEALVGEAPFLNGGLFERDENDKKKGLQVPDECFPRIFRELFGGFNFTVTESTPFDEDVAIDPEMLGRVFEELVVGRHESGSYYTPKPIVAFMCREALKGHLASRLPRVETAAIEQFVDEYDAALIKPYAEEVLDALRTVTVCDPACGSGAYLLGMLHELMHLRGCLFDAAKVDAITAYKRKLEIIHNNVYGVDLEEFAVNIARLRLWLSLAVEFEGTAPPPLPNLDFKIECGDSLLGPPVEKKKGDQFELWGDADQIENWARGLLRQKEQFMKAYSIQKEQLRKAILKQEHRIFEGIKESKFRREDGKPVVFWRVQFFEVFSRGGFDIMLANPPYVKGATGSNKIRLNQNFPNVYRGNADLLCYFYARSIETLRPGGMLVFISSNKWFKAEYGLGLRCHVKSACQVHNIIDFGDLPVFKSAIAYPMIFIAQKRENEATASSLETRFTEVTSLDPPYPDVRAIVNSLAISIPDVAMNDKRWLLVDAKGLAKIEKMEASGITLEKYIDGRLYRGILTGKNDAFFIDGAKRSELIAQDPRSEEIIKPLAQGKDINKWRIDQRDQWIILTKMGVSIKKYPAVFKHLKKWQPELEKRCDQGNYWWELRACDYYDEFESPKIVYQEIATYQSFAYDEDGLYFNNKVFIIPTNDLFLLAVLNSSQAWEYLRLVSSKLVGGALAMQTPYLFSLPIPKATHSQKRTVSALVKKCLKAKNVDRQDIEKQIDEIIENLYFS